MSRKTALTAATVNAAKTAAAIATVYGPDSDEARMATVAVRSVLGQAREAGATAADIRAAAGRRA